MLQDPLILKPLELTDSVGSLASGTFTFPVVDYDPGSRSVRKCVTLLGGVSTFSISHSESKENKGQITDRSAIRIDCRKTQDSGVDVTAQATLTVSSPRTGFTQAEVVQLVSMLIMSVYTTKVDDGPDIVTDDTTLKRILNGEA